MNGKNERNLSQMPIEEYSSEEIRKMKSITTGVAIFGGLATLVGFGNASDVNPETGTYITSMILGYSGAITAVTGFAGVLYFHTLDMMKNREPMNWKKDRSVNQDENINYTKSEEEELLLTDRLGRDIMLFSGHEHGYGTSDYKRLIRELDGYSRGR